MGARRVISRGLLLLVPAGLVWAFAVVWPTVRLVAASFDRPTELGPGVDVRDNYSSAFADGFGSSLLAALSTAALPLLVFVVVGVLLGWAGSHAGRRVRLAVRCAVAAPLACFVPAVAGVVWLFTNLGNDLSRFARGHASTSDLRIAVLVGTLPLMCGAGAMVYLAAFRGGRRTVMVVTGLAVLTAAAAGVQEFTTQALIVGNGGLGVLGFLARWGLPTTRILEDTALFGPDGEFGPAAADAVILVAVLAILGVLAVGLLITTGTRLMVAPGRQVPEPPGQPRAKVVAGVVVVAVLAAAGCTLWPWVRGGQFGGLDEGGHDSVGRFALTWLPSLPSTLVGVGVALLAGFGIGAMRPLGRSSELLLLPFAPWLFVGIPPYAVARLLDVHVGLVSHTPPTWLSVPALVVFTLLFAGQQQAYRQAVEEGAPVRAAFIQAYVRPVLPMVVLVGLVVWVLQANDYFWRALLTLVPVVQNVDLGVLRPVPLGLIAVAVLVGAQFYLDRLAIVTRGKDPESPESGRPFRRAIPAEVSGGLPAPSLATPVGSLPPVPSHRALLPAGLVRRWAAAWSAGPGGSPQLRDGRRNLRAMLVCGVMGIAFAGTGIVVGCGVNTGAPPRLPGAPSAPPDGTSRSTGPSGFPNLAPGQRGAAVTSHVEVTR
jgi:hypothetical protein